MPRSISCALGVLLLASLPASATTMRVLTPDELVAAAERIVVGRVESREAVWIGTRIFTRHGIVVEETWRGPATERLEVLTFGGVVGEIGQRVAGAARLRVDERLVLFLVPGKGGVFHPVSLWQGAFHIADNTPLPVLERDDNGALLVNEPPVFPADLHDLRRAVEEATRAR